MYSPYCECAGPCDFGFKLAGFSSDSSSKTIFMFFSLTTRSDHASNFHQVPEKG